MTRNFPDELLSAYVDDELTPAEREQVEQHLATSESARLLVTELQSLRSELAALPAIDLGESFTVRVMQAAVAAKATHGFTAAPPSVENSPARSGPTAAITPEPGFAGIILAEAD
jgi:anti-sigma factor RsiW